MERKTAKFYSAFLSAVLAFVFVLESTVVFASGEAVPIGNVEVCTGGYTVLNGEYEEYSDYVSDDTETATCMHSYGGIYIYGVKEGNTTVNCKKDGNSYRLNVTVKNPVLTLNKTAVTLDIMDSEENYDYWLGEVNPSSVFLVAYHDSYNKLQVSSSNSSVATARCVEYYDIDEITNTTENTAYPILISAYKKGTATLTVSDSYGNKQTVKITVTDKEGDEELREELYEELAQNSYDNNIYYGNTAVSGWTLSKATVVFKINGKEYKKTASDNGYFKFTGLPVCKIGAKYTFAFYKNGVSYRYSSKVRNNNPYMENYYLYKNQTKFKGLVKNVHKGDIITVKIGKKKYTKKVTKNASKFNYTLKVKKAKFGTKITINIKNKFKQTLTSYNDIVYYAKEVKKGMTMKQAKCVPGWTNPKKKEHYDNATIWWYDDDGDGYADDSYLYFNSKGKLKKWWYTE